MSQSLSIDVVRLPHGADLPLPSYATVHAAGMDLVAAIKQDIVLMPGTRALIPTGLSIAVPVGYEAQVRPRSGLALKNGITVLNSPGTIDADYRGEIQVILANLSDQAFTISRGMRIAQMVIAAHMTVHWDEVEVLSETARGTGGFGSTGTKSETASKKVKDALV